MRQEVWLRLVADEDDSLDPNYGSTPPVVSSAISAGGSGAVFLRRRELGSSDFISFSPNHTIVPHTDVAITSDIRSARRDAATEGSSRDFGKDIIPYIVKNGSAWAHRFPRSCVRSPNEEVAYWRDVGTIDAYWKANVDLCDVQPQLDLYDRDWPIWTFAEITPPAKFVHDFEGRRGSAVNSLVSGDCIVSGGSLERTLLSTGSRVHSYSQLHEAVVLPYCTINRGARLSKVVVDRGVVIPDGLVVGEDAEFDKRWFRRTDDGVTLITQPMIDHYLASK